MPGGHSRGADVARFTGADDVVERLKRLLDRRLVVEPVNLQQVDMVGRQATQAGLDGIEDVSINCLSTGLVLMVYWQEISLEQLSDIKAKSIVEWIANDRVRRSIIRHFRQFLMTYVDEHAPDQQPRGL